MSSIGLKLLSSVVGTGSIQEFIGLGLEEHLFRGSEVEVFQFINKHVMSFGVIPSVDTVLEKVGGHALVDASEPPEFYLVEAEKRYIQSALKKMITDTQECLVKQDPDAAFDMALNIISELHLQKHKRHIIDFRDAADVIKAEYIKQKQMDESYITKMGWPSLDNMVGGLRGGDMLSIVGRPACLSGETRIYISRKSKGSGRWYSLAQVYQGMSGCSITHKRGWSSGKPWDLSIATKTQSLMDDNLTGLNTIEEVLKTGVKTTYTVVTSSGHSCRYTLDHMLLTPNGYTPLGELSVGSEVICAHKKSKKPKSKSPYRKEICTKLPFSPYPTKVINGSVYHRVLEQRAVFDASLNGVSLNAFLEGLRSNPSHGYVFSKSGLHVHHADHDSSHNSEGNLVLISNSDHGKLHSKESNTRRHFGLNEVAPEKIVSITLFGEEETYDLVMADPYNNFIAGGIVTHNSGKTFLGLYSAEQTWMHGGTPLFLSMEMPNIQIAQRVATMNAHKPLTQLLKGMMSSSSWKAFQTSLHALKKKEKPFWLIDGNLATSVDGLVSMARQLKPSAVYVDGAYLLTHPDRRISRFEKITENAEALKKRVATELDLPVIASYQFSREAEKKKKSNSKHKEEVGLEDIYGSDAIGQLSSVVLGLFEEESIETLIRRRVEVLKGRHGETGSFLINWDFINMDFSEIPSKKGADGKLHEDTADLQFL